MMGGNHGCRIVVLLDLFILTVHFNRSTNTKYKPNGELKTAPKGCRILTILPPLDLGSNAVNKHFIQWAKTLQKIKNCARLVDLILSAMLDELFESVRMRGYLFQ